MNIDFAQKVTVSPEALFQEVSGETVILDLNSEQYFSLDEVGTRIWQLLQESAEIQSVYDVLLEEYDVEPAILKADIHRLLQELIKVGLVSTEVRE